MAFAALIAEHALGIVVLEHLNRANAVLAPGSARRADLFGLDGTNHWACDRGQGANSRRDRADLDRAKQQARNVVVVLPRGVPIMPATHSAALADLSSTPISVELLDPDQDPVEPARYEIEPEHFIASHFATVPRLLEVQGGAQPAPVRLEGREVVGAFLPGTEIWLGLDAALLGESQLPWQDRVGARAAFPLPARGYDDERVSVGADGHVLQLGDHLAYERAL
jgi:hypothetical protein